MLWNSVCFFTSKFKIVLACNNTGPLACYCIRCIINLTMHCVRIHTLGLAHVEQSEKICRVKYTSNVRKSAISCQYITGITKLDLQHIRMTR